MSAQTIRNALGLLQDDSDNEQAWASLSAAVGLGSEAAHHGMSPDELFKLFQAARRAHEMRREYDAVARLLHMEATVSKGTGREVEALGELAKMLDEELLDDVRAMKVYGRILKLAPGDAQAEDAISRSEAKRAKWRELVARYVEEAKTTGEAAFKSSLLVSAAEVKFRYGRPQLEKGRELDALIDEIVLGLKEAIEVDPKNRRAELLLERVYRRQERWGELADVIEKYATDATAKDEKVSGFIRLARVFAKKLGERARGMAAYERVLELAPGNPEATSALVDFYTEGERWEDLISLYDTQLKTGAVRGAEEVGILLQIAMVQWKVRGSVEDAEPYFERLRKIEPAHPTVLGFFREWCGARGENGRLLAILVDAQRAMPESPERAEISREIAKYAEEGANASKAIEQWRALLRQDPNNRDAREALKRLYRQTGTYAPLADLLRQDLERIAQDDAAGRLPTLREIASLYRGHLKNDAALVTVLSQIIALDPSDIDSLRELARVYETLGRWRDLLTVQMRVAELEPEVDAKAELYRAVARRWLEQFSNVQNAVEAYEKLHAVVPEDREAYEKLRELYTKRRAYKALYELLEDEVGRIEVGGTRRDVLLEMAKLASERLDRGADAMALYRRILDEDPSATEALDALEKQADREKDFATVASVLERRVELAEDDATRLTVLQKLGAIYSDRLQEHAGAMRAWRRVLELSPGHAKALRVLRDGYLALRDYDALTELYAAQHDWEGLAEVLSGAADRASQPPVKVELSYRAADVYAEKLRTPERAFRAYERVLAAEPNDKRAASALVPLYEKDEKWARLPSLYEVLLGHAEAEEDRLQLLGKLADVTGKRLQDRASSFTYARRAYEAAPSTPGALATFEENARAAGAWEDFAGAISDRLRGEAVPADERRALRGRLAETYGTELGMLDESVAIYRELVEEDERDESAVQTLDRILRGADRRDDLRWHFNLRIERANTAQKLDLLTEWAALEEDAFSDPAAAIALYRRILEIVPQHGASLRALARLLRASGDAEGAVEYLERDRDQRSGAERAAREVEIAHLFADELGRPVDALAAARRALGIAPNDAPAIEVVEALLPVAETRAAAAATLEESYAATGKYAQQADVLGVMIATAAAKEDRIALHHRLADVHDEKLDRAQSAFEVIARAAKEFPSELELWDRLSVLANKTRRSQAFVDAIAEAVPATGATGLPPHVEMDLAERAATLYEEKLGDLDRAKPYLERILEREPANERAFARLKQILTTREAWIEIEAMYERAVAAVPEVSRRAELLSEVALIAEEITNERPKAIVYYERILELDPLFEQAIRSLDVLYAAEGRWDSLAKLLVRRLETSTAEEARVLKLRLGGLYFTKLSEPALALDQLEEVLEAEPTNREATELTEQELDVPEQRARAARVLEAVYASRDEVTDLVRILEIRLEFAANDDERRELLRRIAELRDDRLHEDQGAFDAYARLVPLDPTDTAARERLLDIGRRTDGHERAADVLKVAAAAASAPQPRAEILTDVAKIYEHQVNDSARAEAVYREILDLAPEDATIALPAARSLEAIYAAAGKNPELAEMLGAQVKLEDDTVARREIYGRLGELYETVLGNPRGAIEAWRARLEEDPTDEQALAALDRLYLATSEWRPLVEILRSRERQSSDPAVRKELMTRTATTLAEKLIDVPEAILAYRAILDEYGPEQEPLRALETLYEVAERWQDLADTLEASLTLTDVASERLALLARLGHVRQHRLEDVPGALEAYRQTLALDAAHAPSRAALEGLLTDTAARRDAAGILRPLYEADGDHEKLLRVVEIEVEHAESVGGRLALYGEGARIAEEPLRNPGRAFDYVARGLREAAAEPEAREWTERAERLAGVTRRHADFVTLFREIAPDVLDEDLQVDVALKIADTARGELGDRELAREYYVKALELRADERRGLIALESLYEATKDADALLDILKRRADAAESDAERKALLFKQARLDDETLGDAPGAIQVYETVLDMGFDADAESALERLYSAAERWSDLIALHEREIALDTTAPERKATLHHKLGVVLEKRTGDIARAFEEYENALRIDAQHAATVASLEALMEEGAYSARAAEMLEAVYLVRLDWRRVIATIAARLATSEDPDDRRTLLRRLAKLYEEQGEDYKAALETNAKLLAEDITDEATWAELERLARVANADTRLALIFATELEKVTTDEPATARLSKRAGELYEALGDTERSLTFYRRSYAFAPEDDDESFTAIDRLLKLAERPDDRVALYRGALEHRVEPDARISTLHTIAQIQEVELKDDAAAIETYRAALEIDETDQRSLETLSRLYERTSCWRELADHTRKRAEQSAAPEDEAKFRQELGKLHETRLDETTIAIDEYEAVVGLVDPVAHPTGKEAVVALEGVLVKGEHDARLVEILRPIYERADDWRKLVSLNDVRLALTSDVPEKVLVFRETARFWEERGGDRNKAFDAMRDAFVLDPEDGESREQLDRLAEATKRWDDLADAYEKGIAIAADMAQRELLGALARVHDRRRDDPRRSLEAWERLFKLDESDINPLEEMDALATLLSDWPTLVRVLAKKAELLMEDEARASTWRRIGESRRDMLDDAGGAIDAYERALELEPDSAFTLDNLIDLYEAKNHAERLVDLYRRRVELCGEYDEELKFRLLVDAANRYELGLDDRREAIAHLNEALTVKPGDVDVTRRLDGLYTHENMWPELLENLRLQASASTDDGERRNLKKRIGALLAGELDDPAGALDAYREVLTSGFHRGVVAAVRQIGEARDELRIEAADTLEPVLRGANEYSELADVLEMRLRAQTEPGDRSRTLRSLAQVAEESLKDDGRAEHALVRAMGEEPADAELHGEIERLAERLGREGWQRYADALNDRAGTIFDAAITTDLYSRLGQVAEQRLEDDLRASRAYVLAAERGGDSPAILTALDRLYVRLEDARSLADVLERRIAIEPDASAQAELLHRLARIQVSDFGEKAAGLTTLRRALEAVTDHLPSRQAIEALLADDDLFDEAFEALEWVYRALSLHEDLAKLYERKVTRAYGAKERIVAKLDLARVLEEQVKDAERAQRAVESALADDPTDLDVLAELERLAGVTTGWRAAAEALRGAVADARELSAPSVAELTVRFAVWQRDRLDDAGGAEESFALAQKSDPENMEILRSIEALQRVPGRERDLVETLRRRAKLEGDPSARRDVLREAKALAEGSVGDVALAEATLRELLAEDEADLWALEELTRLRDAAGDHAEVVKLLLLRSEHVSDGAEALALKHRAATVATESLGDKARAIALYEEILEQEPADANAATRLRALLAAEGRHRELAKLIGQLIDVASTSDERAKLRLDLAALQDTRFDAPRDAADTLRAILEEDAGHQDAVVALSQLLEKTGQDEELAELLNSQIERARERGDAQSELALQVRLGEVFERRLLDTARALATYEAVLEREPTHAGALEAVARLAEGRGAWDRAETALHALVAMANDASGVSIALRLATAREHRGDIDGVEDALQRALSLDARNADVRGRLRAHYEKSKKWAELADLLVGDVDLMEVPAAAPAAPTPVGQSVPPPAGPVGDLVRLLRRAAEIHLKERRSPADAIPILERASDFVPHDRELLLVLCDAYASAHRDREAASVLERVIASFGTKRTKELAVYHHRLGRALGALGERDQALAQFDLAFKIDPGSVTVLKDLGVLAFETDDLDRAQKTFRALLLQRLDANAGISKGEVFYYLGEISAKQGDKAKAVQMFERAVENEPTLDRAKSKLAELKG